MAIDKDSYQRVLQAIQHLSTEEQRQLIKQLTRELEAEAPVTSLALIGSWAGVSLSAEEIDEFRRECWAGLGDRA